MFWWSNHYHSNVPCASLAANAGPQLSPQIAASAAASFALPHGPGWQCITDSVPSSLVAQGMLLQLLGADSGYRWTDNVFCTRVTPGAAHAARSASSRSYQELTSPVRVISPPATAIFTLFASNVA